MTTRTLQILATVLILAAIALLGWRGLLLEVAPVTLRWTTESEVNSIGFNVYRADAADGPYERVSPDIIPSAGDPFSGGRYEFPDRTVEPNRTYYYQIEDLESTGVFNRYPDTTVVRTSYQPRLLTALPLLIALILVWLLPRPTPRRTSGSA